jgi:Fic family protein
MEMARANGAKTEIAAEEVLEVTGLEETELQEIEDVEELETASAKGNSSQPVTDAQEIDECLNALKTLLSSVEKLQKVRQELGDIKPLLVKLLDGEILSGEDLEQLKTGVSGLFRLVRTYSDYQTALANAQPARQLLDEVLKVRGTGG